MAVRSLTITLLFLAADLLMLALFPAFRLLVDPLLLLLVVLASRFRSVRSIWLLGLGLGFLKDLYAGALFGAWACTFAGVAWTVGATRRMVEWEDAAVVGVWTSVLTLLAWVFHGLWLTLADPFIRWGDGQWVLVPVSIGVQGLLAAWLFPHLRRRIVRATPVYHF